MRAILLALALSVLASQALAVDPDEVLDNPALEARAREISANLRCLVCQNQSIDDSDAALAKDLRVIVRESNYNPAARNGPYYGLMQISHATASGMGYRGAPAGLLNADTNLRYAVRYLAGAYMTAGGNEDQAVRFYARGYYYDAKRAGLLEKSGLR